MHKLITLWAKSSEEGENHIFRKFVCPITRNPTSLAPLQVISAVHAIGKALDLSFKPPIRFVYKHDDKWVDFKLKDQLSLASQVYVFFLDTLTTIH